MRLRLKIGVDRDGACTYAGPSLSVLALQLLCVEDSESMGAHDSEIVDADSVD